MTEESYRFVLAGIEIVLKTLAFSQKFVTSFYFINNGKTNFFTINKLFDQSIDQFVFADVDGIDNLADKRR